MKSEKLKVRRIRDMGYGIRDMGYGIHDMRDVKGKIILTFSFSNRKIVVSE